MKLPEIDEKITTDRAIELCEHFGYIYLVERIKANQDRFKDWVFDGASMIPDKIFSQTFHIPNLIEIALKHDLKYAYGERGNKAEKLRADLEFALDLLNDGASSAITRLMFAAVDVGGNELFKTSYSWGYAWK
jgi:hypothetical protein